MLSHVVPGNFTTKKTQWKALFSIGPENTELSWATLIIGDVNRFSDDKEKVFDDCLKEFDLDEAVPTELVIPGYQKIITKDEDIGTFSPWPNEEIYADKMKRPLKESRLDAHLYSKTEKLVKKSVIVRPSLLDKYVYNNEPPPEGVDPVRHLLDKRMVSDHLAIISCFEVKQ